jgi:RNA polymerase sigma-70 factor (ECF subfamily)
LTDVSSAEDVVHDVFVSFIESRSRFRLTGSLKGYLATCVANNARNKNKAGRRQQTAALDNRNIPASARTGLPLRKQGSGSQCPDVAAMFGEELRRLSWSLAELPYEQREVLLLHIYSGMRFRAIARSQAVSINTVQGRYRYALDKLRSMLDGEAKNETSR